MQSGLIEMTAHMIARPEAVAAIVAGGILLAIWAVLTTRQALAKRWRRLLMLSALGIAGAALLIQGASTPRVKEIQCCASGPVSLEMIATKYDIRGVDGKLLTLWER